MLPKFLFGSLGVPSQGFMAPLKACFSNLGVLLVGVLVMSPGQYMSGAVRASDFGNSHDS